MLRQFSKAFRSLARSPLHTALSVVTLGAGLAGCAVMFALVDAVIYKPLPFPSPRRLVRVQELNLETGDLEDLSPGNFADWKARSRSFRSMALASNGNFIVSGGGAVPEQVPGMRVSAEFFSALGATPLTGRAFSIQDFDGGGTAMVSFDLARTRFGGAAEAVGRKVDVDDQVLTVIGVLPEDFRLPGLLGDTEQTRLFLPLDVPTTGAGFCEWSSGAAEKPQSWD